MKSALSLLSLLKNVVVAALSFYLLQQLGFALLSAEMHYCSLSVEQDRADKYFVLYLAELQAVYLTTALSFADSVVATLFVKHRTTLLKFAAACLFAGLKILLSFAVILNQL